MISAGTRHSMNWNVFQLYQIHPQHVYQGINKATRTRTRHVPGLYHIDYTQNITKINISKHLINVALVVWNKFHKYQMYKYFFARMHPLVRQVRSWSLPIESPVFSHCLSPTLWEASLGYPRVVILTKLYSASAWSEWWVSIRGQHYIITFRLNTGRR